MEKGLAMVIIYKYIFKGIIGNGDEYRFWKVSDRHNKV